MRHPARMKALLVGAACGVALLGAGVAFRKDLAFHCHAWRLERALTPEAAECCLSELEEDVQDPRRAQRLVAMLGPRWPRLTFWTFEWPSKSRVTDRVFSFPPPGWPRHFARSLEARLRRDEGLLNVMAHFNRWKGRAPWLLNAFGFLAEVGIRGKFKRPLLGSEPGEQEAVVTTFEVRLLAQAWVLGMSPLPPPVELSFPLCEADVDRVFRRWEDMEGWARARRDRRFDPAVGRFVEVPDGQGSLKVPVPAEPLPGWTGPVPQLR